MMYSEYNTSLFMHDYDVNDPQINEILVIEDNQYVYKRVYVRRTESVSQYGLQTTGWKTELDPQ
jgi:hypothetical protein